MSTHRASVLAGTVTRTWFTSSEGEYHVIQLRHHTVSGYRYVIVDGREVQDSEGTTTLLSQENNAHDVVVWIGSKAAVVRILPSGATAFEYQCAFEGTRLTEMNAMAELAVPATRVSVTVPAWEQMVDPSGKPAVYYRVDCVRQDDEKGVSALRRFSEFVELNDDVRSAFQGSHTASMLPHMPAKGFKIFQDHSSPEFVERRRAQLEAFLQALVRVPRVMSLPDMLVFFQLTDRIAAVPLSAHVRTDVALTAPMLPNLGDVDSASFVDVSYAFAPGALGLRLKEGRGTSAPCFIAQFVADPRGGPGQAEKGGVLRVGDVLTRISGQSVADLSYDEVVALIREAPRPVTVHFRRYVPRRAPAHAQPAAHAHLDRADDPPLAAAVAQPAASAAGGGEGRDSAAGDADADAAGTKRSAVGELRVLDGGAMALPIGKHELTFPRPQVVLFDDYLTQAAPGAVSAGRIDGAAAANFLRLSGLSNTQLQKVWRLACGGRSAPSLTRSQWFLAMRLVALVQQEGDEVLGRAGPRLVEREDALPVFQGVEVSPTALAAGAGAVVAGGAERPAEDEDLFAD